MVVDFLKRIQNKFYNHILNFAKQTALGGPKYFINRGTIEGAKDKKTGENRDIKISRFDR